MTLLSPICLHRWSLVLALTIVPTHALAADEESTEEQESDAEIVVTGTRTDASRRDSVIATHVIDREEIESSGSTDVAELLSVQPGVSLERTFAGTSVRLQGLNPEHVLVLIDGQRVIGRKNGAIDLARYPVDWIERIEIVKGPSSVLYGSDAMGGVINIITRQADAAFSADIYTSYGTPSDIDGSGSIATKQEGYSTRVHGGYHSGAGYDLDETTLATDGSARETIHAGSISQIEILPDWHITPRISYRIEDKNRITESGTGAVFDDRNLSEEVQGALGSDTWLSDTGRLRATAFATYYRDQYDSNQRNSDALDSYQDTTELLFQGAIQYDQLFVERHQTTFGVDALSEQMQSDRLHKEAGKRQRVGLFAQDEWSLPTNKRLVLFPAARIDLDSQFGTHTTPRFALRYDPHQRVALRAGYGWGYRAPSFKELLLRFENPSAGYTVEGSPNLRPESSRNVQTGIDWNAVDSVWISLSGYRNDVHDLIGFRTLDDEVANSPTRYGYVNISEVITQGAEINVESTVSANTSLSSNYTLNDTLDVLKNRPLEGRSKHRASGQFNQRFPTFGTSINIRAAWEGPKPYFRDVNADDIEETVETDGTTLIDARLGQEMSFKRTVIQLFVGSANILNDGDSEYLPLPPRTFYAGLTGRYATE